MQPRFSQAFLTLATSLAGTPRGTGADATLTGLAPTAGIPLRDADLRIGAPRRVVYAVDPADRLLIGGPESLAAISWMMEVQSVEPMKRVVGVHCTPAGIGRVYVAHTTRQSHWAASTAPRITEFLVIRLDEDADPVIEMIRFIVGTTGSSAGVTEVTFPPPMAYFGDAGPLRAHLAHLAAAGPTRELIRAIDGEIAAIIVEEEAEEATGLVE